MAAVITAQSDLRFFPSTFAAVLAQRVLPGTIIVADCTNQVEQPMQMTFDVIPSPAGVLTEVPESKTVRVVLVGVKGATSFTNAVSRAIRQIDLDAQVSALWTWHDDSRPADELCLEALLDAWRNTPTASLLGAKQLDWQAKNLHNVGLYAGHHNLVMGNPIRNSMMAGRMCWQFRFPARWFHWLPCERGRALIPGLAPSPNPWIYAGASAWVEVVWWCRRLGLPIEEHGSTAYAPKVASRSKTRMAASIHILRSVRRTRNMRTRMCIVPGGLCCGSGRLSRRWA